MVKMKMKKSTGVGMTAVVYILVDYLRYVSPSWHQTLQPILCVVLALLVIVRVPAYKHWSLEFDSAVSFIGSLMFMLVVLLIESICTTFATVVVGLQWHRDTAALPDMGQWLLLWWNEKLPTMVVEILRAPIVGLHHFLMLFIMLAFSALFNSIKAPGLGIATRYMFSMGVGRVLRIITFLSTLLPSPRPWCASHHFKPPRHPHPWAQKYHIPYASDRRAIRRLLERGEAYVRVRVGSYPPEYQPEWGIMNFLVDFLRPTDPTTKWYNYLSTAKGGCSDLVFSGHMFTAALTAMAWTEAEGGWSSCLIWLLVMHKGQREIRERFHYSVDCVVAVCVGIILWRMTDFIWSPNPTPPPFINTKRFIQVHPKIYILQEDQHDERRSRQRRKEPSQKTLTIFGFVIIIVSFGIVILAITCTSDG